MKFLTVVLLLVTFNVSAKTKVVPSSSEIVREVATQGKILNVETNINNDIYFYLENGYCVKFDNIKKIVCNL